MKNAVKKQDIFELLVQADMEHTELALQLDRHFEKLRIKYPCDDDTDGWDPDAHYTPLEITLKKLAELVGIDYDAILHESSRRLKEQSTYVFLVGSEDFNPRIDDNQED